MYKVNNNSSIPWFEKSNADISINKIDIPDELLFNVKEIIEKGYTVIDLSEFNSVFDSISKEIELLVKTNEVKKNPDYYHYNDSPRVIEAWKRINDISKIANEAKIINFLYILYQKKPIPFSTINFIKSTEQPLHSDYIHFSSIPERYLAGCWFALEDINIDAGPLQLVPKSHKLPIVTLKDLGASVPKNLIHLKKNNTLYEDYVKAQIKDLDMVVDSPKLKKGDCLVWAANVLHGAPKIKNNSLTRKSMVIHYHFSKCKYYNPGFSDVEKSNFQYRELEIVK